MHQTNWQPHRLHLCHKATMIEIVGAKHSFDPVVHDNRSLRPLLFDSTSDADQFLSILTLYSQPLPVCCQCTSSDSYHFWFGNFLPNAREKRSTVFEFSISTISLLSSNHCHHNHGSWFWPSPSSLSVLETIAFLSRNMHPLLRWWRGDFVRTTFNRSQTSC